MDLATDSLSLIDIQRTYVWFVLQLRKQKKKINIAKDISQWNFKG